MNKPFLVPTLFLFFAFGVSGFVAGQSPTWRVELLGPADPGWSPVWAVAVNNAGQVVGNTYVSGWKRGWVAAQGEGVELLPLPAGMNYCEVHDINAHGVVAGSAFPAGSGSRAVIWEPGPTGYQPLLLPVTPDGLVPFSATGLNDAGEVVGKLVREFVLPAGSYVWSEDTGVTQITSATFPKIPIDINVQRQIVGGDYRMDLDTFDLEILGNPTGTPYSYLYTEFLCVNDIGESAGYSVTTTNQSTKYLAVRYTDGPDEPVWRLFNSTPWTSASALGISAGGDTVFQLGATFGTFVYVEGFGSITLEDLPAPDYASWDLTDSFPPAISPSGRLACTGINVLTSEGGITLLTPSGFEDRGGAIAGELGDPILSGYGSAVPGEPARLRLANAAPNSTGFYFISTNQQLSASLASVLAQFQTDALGRTELTIDWPQLPAGSTFTLQARVLDPAATNSTSASNVLQGVTQ